MADIFISYAHEDQPFVRRMVPALEAEGFSVWWDHTIPPGQSWDNFIARGIKEAKAAIVVWSSHSVGSEWVKEEAQLSRGSGKYLPVQIDSSDPPIGFSRIQAAQLTGWDGNANDPQWQMLVGEARRVMSEAGVLPSHAPRAQRHAAPVDEPKKSGAVGILIVLLVVGALGAGGYFYFNSGGLHAATPTTTATTQTSENSELTELRRQMAATQAALDEERRLREGAQKSDTEPRATTPATTQRVATTASPPQESTFERRDRLEREAKGTGLEGYWYVVTPSTDAVGECNSSRRYDGIRIVGDQLSGLARDHPGNSNWDGDGLFNFQVWSVSEVRGQTIIIHQNGGEGRIQVQRDVLVIDTIRDNGTGRRFTLRRCS